MVRRGGPNFPKNSMKIGSREGKLHSVAENDLNATTVLIYNRESIHAF